MESALPVVTSHHGHLVDLVDGRLNEENGRRTAAPLDLAEPGSKWVARPA